jgi:hypothetical protein
MGLFNGIHPTQPVGGQPTKGTARIAGRLPLADDRMAAFWCTVDQSTNSPHATGIPALDPICGLVSHAVLYEGLFICQPLRSNSRASRHREAISMLEASLEGAWAGLAEALRDMEAHPITVAVTGRRHVHSDLTLAEVPHHWGRGAENAGKVRSPCRF